MPAPPATREEIIELIGEVDESFIDRIRDTGASIDDIAEARDDLEGRFGQQPLVASSTTVVAVHAILKELFADEDYARSIAARGVPVMPSP
ncbi:MAG TPA: hypothetical protein VIV40_37840 [Kofleriaceae bacterium]